MTRARSMCGIFEKLVKRNNSLFFFKYFFLIGAKSLRRKARLNIKCGMCATKIPERQRKKKKKKRREHLYDRLKAEKTGVYLEP